MTSCVTGQFVELTVCPLDSCCSQRPDTNIDTSGSKCVLLKPTTEVEKLTACFFKQSLTITEEAVNKRSKVTAELMSMQSYVYVALRPQIPVGAVLNK